MVAALAALLASCSFEAPTSAVAASYDLGPPPAYSKSNPGIKGTLLIPPVKAPAWLDEAEIVYRLMYDESSHPRTYSKSRWAADPASLVTDRIRSRFAAVSAGVVTPGYGASSDYTLRIEIDDFSQRFDAPQQSRATLLARASLLSTRERKLLAQREFNLERPSMPNAQGAVQALSEATNAFVEDLVTWTTEHARGQ
jgi:cholesterol transport system auxiliary component